MREAITSVVFRDTVAVNHATQAVKAIEAGTMKCLVTVKTQGRSPVEFQAPASKSKAGRINTHFAE